MNTVSVVIPSLGKINLLKIINILNAGTIVPDEILICIPNGTELEFEIPSNSRLIYCSKRSQVAQRAKGFKYAQSEFVLQLDDDTHLSPNCLEILLETAIKCNRACAVAPAILNEKTKRSIYENDGVKSPFNTFKNFIANGMSLYKPGAITKVGTCFGPGFGAADSIQEVEWLAGCCVLHHRSNLIYDDYFPFKGKAYNEDLIASYLYKLKSITFYVCNEALCYTAPYIPDETSFFELIKDLKVKRYYMILSDKLTPRFYIYVIFKCLYDVLVSAPKRLLNKVFS